MPRQGLSHLLFHVSKKNRVLRIREFSCKRPQRREAAKKHTKQKQPDAPGISTVHKISPGADMQKHQSDKGPAVARTPSLGYIYIYILGTGQATASWRPLKAAVSSLCSPAQLAKVSLALDSAHLPTEGDEWCLGVWGLQGL